LIPGHDLAGSDNVPVKVTRGEAILPVKTVDAMGGPDAVGQLIHATNGTPPAGLKAAGRYALGMTGDFVDTMNNYPRRGSIPATPELSAANNAVISGVPETGFVPQSPEQAFLHQQADVNRANAQRAAAQAGNPGSATFQGPRAFEGPQRPPQTATAADPAVGPSPVDGVKNVIQDGLNKAKSAGSRVSDWWNRAKAPSDAMFGIPEASAAKGAYVGNLVKNGVNPMQGGGLVGGALRPAALAANYGQHWDALGNDSQLTNSEKAQIFARDTTRGLFDIAGGTIGAVGGGVAGSFAAPVVGTVAGGLAGGVGGGMLADNAIEGAMGDVRKGANWVNGKLGGDPNYWEDTDKLAARAMKPGSSPSMIQQIGNRISGVPNQDPGAQDPAQAQQSANQAQQAAKQAEADQAAYKLLGTGPQGTGDTYSAEDRATIGRAQNKWLSAQGISQDDMAQPAQSYQQAEMNSRQTGGPNGLEAAKNYKLQYGPDAAVYGRSDRADGKLNNFTGIGDGTTWESRHPQDYQDALNRAAAAKQSLYASVMARASSGDRDDYNKAVQLAAGDGTLMAAVDAAHAQKSHLDAAWSRDPAGMGRQQLVEQGNRSLRQATMQNENYYRNLDQQNKQAQIAMSQNQFAREQQNDALARGDKTYDRRIQALKDKNTVDGKLDNAGFNADTEFMRRGLAETGHGLEDADNQVFDAQLDKSRIANAPETWSWLKSLTGMHDPAIKTAQDAVLMRTVPSLLGDYGVFANGATRRMRDIQGGGVGPFATPVDSSQVRRDQRDLRYGQRGS
jgi:hypothetical protein